MQNAPSVVARPRFRQDLVAELVEEGGQRFIDVADPDSGHMFRFFEVEYSLACAMDGERDVAGIVKWAQDELGITPTPTEVQAVISQLSDLRFVGTDRTVDAAATKGQPKAEELAKGIVVGKQANATASADVELGKAGTSAAPPREEKLPAADFALGASGASAAKAQAKAPVEDIALGAPGAAEARRPASSSTPPAAADMSLDLADNFALKPGDVKEAVRQSKVMTAVEVPKDLLEAEAKPAKPIEKKPPEPKQPEKQPEPVKAKEPEKKPTPVEKKPEPVKAKEPEKAPEKKAEPAKTEKKPVELKKQPVVEKQPVAPPAPQQGVSPLLISILILVVIGAGAFFVWKFVINKDETAQNTPPPPKLPEPPPPPPEAMSKIVMETPPPIEIKAATAGALESIEPADKDVKAGDVIATLVGAKALQTELDKLTADIAKLQPAIDTADEAYKTETAKENNEAGVNAAQAKLDRAKKPLNDKTATQKTKQAELEKLTIKATADGKLVAADAEAASPLKVGDKVTVDQVIAKVARPTAPVATFKIPSGTKIAADGTLSIKAGDDMVVCTVSDAQVETVKVTCPSDAGLADGADVKFTLPK